MLKLTIFILVTLFFVGYYEYQETHGGNEGPRFASDERELEMIIFQKDSENRGYSDIVKDKISSSFDDPEIRTMVGNYAKSRRNLLKSKTSREFVINQKISIVKMSCAFYIIHKSDKFKNKAVSLQNLVSDNKKMQSYYEYLSLIRFNQEENNREADNWINNQLSQVKTDQDYKTKCLN